MTHYELWESLIELQNGLDASANSEREYAEGLAGELGAYHAGRADALKLVVRLLSTPAVDGEPGYNA